MCFFVAVVVERVSRQWMEMVFVGEAGKFVKVWVVVFVVVVFVVVVCEGKLEIEAVGGVW